MSIEALKEQARGHEQDEEWEKALALYVQAIQRQGSEDQPDLGLYNRAGDLSTRLGNLEGALEYYEQAVKLYLESELPNNAIAILKKILRNMPYRSDVFLQMGQIRARQGFLVDARENFLRYAEVMQQEDNVPEALQALTEFAELAPADLDIQFMVVGQLQANERTPAAIEHLTRTYATLVRSGQDAAAVSIGERLREIDPDAKLPSDLDAYGGFESTSLAPADADNEGADALAPRERLVEDAVAEAMGDTSEEFEALDIEHTGLGHDEATATVAEVPLDLEPSAGFSQSPWESELEDEAPLAALDLDDDSFAAMDEDPLPGWGGDDPATGTGEFPELRPDVLEGEDSLPALDLLHPDPWEEEASDWQGVTGAEDEEEVSAVGLDEAWIALDDADEVSPEGSGEESSAETGAVETGWDDTPEDEPLDDGASWLDMAERLQREGETAEAKTALEEAHLAFAEAHEFERASAAVATLIELDPDGVSHHQRRVEYANRTGERPEQVAAYLGLAACLERGGSVPEARATYDKVLEIDPANSIARMFLAAATQPVIESGYVDLGSMVIDRVERTTRWTVESEEPAREEDFDFRQMLNQFKAKVAEHVDVGDVRAHYDLGTAYREMGLVDEAIGEFQLALRGDGKNLATYEMLGQCFMEKGQPEFAVRSLGRATELPHDVEDELLGIYYYLGRAHEELGQRDEAVEFYEKVFALDINFQDVTERLRSLR